jgi:FKBP-type peptidyl-prolyl cis-trans isomerase
MNYDIYERVKLYENQFLEDLRKRDRKFVATTSGLTYKIHELGNLKKTIRNNRDTINIRYRIMDQAGNIIDTTYLNADTLRLAVGDLSRGVIEAAKLIGEGGHMEAWLPSNLAFGSAGCDSLNVKPNTMLYYELWLINVEKR